VNNEERAARAGLAVNAYIGKDAEFYLHDLICDLGHWLDQYADKDAGHNRTLEEACTQGIWHYREELAEEAVFKADPNASFTLGEAQKKLADMNRSQTSKEDDA
jgi:hypothetical protein